MARDGSAEGDSSFPGKGGGLALEIRCRRGETVRCREAGSRVAPCGERPRSSLALAGCGTAGRGKGQSVATPFEMARAWKQSSPE